MSSAADVQIRVATAADREVLIALLLAQLREHEIPLSDADAARAIDGVLHRPELGRLLIATLEGKAIGLAALSFIWTYEYGGRAAWLEELYVAPPHRDCGIGRLLLQAAYRVATDNDAVAMDLEVEASHSRAERLYEREGFVRLNRVRWSRRLYA